MKMKIGRFCLIQICGFLVGSPLLAHADNPHWIWHDNKGGAIKPDEVRYFRKTFTLDNKPGKAHLSVAADDEAVVYINGKQVADPKDYDRPAYEEVGSALKKGQNIIAVRAKNMHGDQAGLVLML